MNHWVFIASGAGVVLGLSVAALDFAGLGPKAESNLLAAGKGLRDWARRISKTYGFAETEPHAKLLFRILIGSSRLLFLSLPFLVIYLVLSFVRVDLDSSGIGHWIVSVLTMGLSLLCVYFAWASTLVFASSVLLMLAKPMQMVAKGPSGLLGLVGLGAAILSALAFSHEMLHQLPDSTDPRPSPHVFDPRPSPHVFQDALHSGGKGPEMVVVPAGQFRMGCPSRDYQCSGFAERPPKSVTIEEPFALSVHELTFDEYDRFTHPMKVDDATWGRGSLPAINVSWHDAKNYVRWLSEETGAKYRLPTEVEWEYAARAGSTTRYSWGDDIDKNLANCKGGYCGDRFKYTAPVGRFPRNAFGLDDMHGNVREWVWNCGSWIYHELPGDEGDWLEEECSYEGGVRGGSWSSEWIYLHAGRYSKYGVHTRLDDVGFRVARDCDADTLPPCGATADVKKEAVVSRKSAPQKRGTGRTQPGNAIAGSTFRDQLRSGGEGPEMVVVPAGQFQMGCLSADEHCRESEEPVHEVLIASPFALSVYEVSFADYDQYSHPNQLTDRGWGRGRRPVINVSWNQARNYAGWLTEQTGAKYRLPTEAEWEYAARAGSTTKFGWGDDLGSGQAHCGYCSTMFDIREWNRKTAPTGSYSPNHFGLHDMLGNVSEWVEDCWNSTHSGAPEDGTARLTGDCSRRVLRGSNWLSSGYFTAHVAYRSENNAAGSRDNTIGFRVARSLP